MKVEDLVLPRPTASKQKKAILAYYDDRCCATGKYYVDTWIEMCHIHDAGLSEYKWLRTLPINTIPLVKKLHTGVPPEFTDCFDYVGKQRRKRGPRDKIKWVLSECSEDWEFLPRIKEQFNLLLNLVDEHE